MEGATRYPGLCYRDEAALAALPGSARDALAAVATPRREELRRNGVPPGTLDDYMGVSRHGALHGIFGGSGSSARSRPA